MNTANMLDQISRLFLPHGRLHGRYRAPEHPECPPTELFAGAVWELPLFPMGSQSYELMRVYALDTTIGALLHAHWRNEARALLRLSTRGHRALPRLREAEIVDGDLAYLILTDSGEPVESQPDLLKALNTDRKQAFRTYFAVVEAVAAMHEEGLLHRNLTTQALRFADDEGWIVVDGFQMSSLVARWFRPRAAEPSALGPTGPARWMLAPERMSSLEKEATREVESYATDVFGLGLLGVRLLVGEFDSPPAVYSRDAHRQWTEKQHLALLQAKLPTMLERALSSMIAFDRSNRLPSAVQAFDVLSAGYGGILADLEWPPTEKTPTHELLYLPEAIARIYGDGRGRSHPSHPDFEEYNDFIEQDLRGAILVWSPDGFDPWERKDENRKIAKTARVVLLGRAYAYFCAYLDAGKSSEDRSRIVVKHMLPADRAGALRHSHRQRSVPRVACAHLTRAFGKPPRVAGTAGHWGQLAETVVDERTSGRREPVVMATRWLLDGQHADLRRAWYAVECQTVGPGRVQLQAIDQPDEHGDDAVTAFDRLWAAVLPREPMGTYFDALAREALDNDLQEEALSFFLRSDRSDRGALAELKLQSTPDPYTCVFSVESVSGPLPDAGWVMPDDRGARAQLRRQADALLEVEQRYSHLAAQLHTPVAFRIPTELDAAHPEGPDPVDALVRQIHETWPLFALQGPPGTGKTFVASRVIARILAEDPFARILVAAQSHHALDNLLEGVASRVGGASMLRIASERTRSKVSPFANRYCRPAQLNALLERIGSVAGRGEGPRRNLCKDWARRPKRSEIELRADLAKRLARSSSVVCSTCAQATTEEVGATRGGGSFDWVIIEEAARGWLAEFLVPMVHGTRWLLVGDHAQLPAHRFQDYERLLRRDIADQVTAEATGVAPTDVWVALLRHFAHLMTTQHARGTVRERLRVQRRMHPDIAGLVSTAFYPDDPLESHPDAQRAHEIESSPFEGTALTWLDTSGLGSDAHEFTDGGIWNLCEINVLKRFFRSRVAGVKSFDNKVAPFAVLTPYRAQAKQLGAHLGYGPDVVHTVHSFQGREAEVVLVSLVRNNASSPEKALGFLIDPTIGNVMLSRARRLLVVVGNLQHFARNGRGTFWDDVTAYFKSDARFVYDVAQAGFQFTPRGAR